MVTVMASAKLANSQPCHPLYHQHLLHHPHFYHLSIIGPPSSATGQMTLDYSLPNRSRVSDSDQSELPSLIAIETQPNGNQSDDAFSNTADESSPQRSSSPAGSENRDRHSPFETPTKKNKRKLSEPKKRADFKIKRLCPGVEPSEKPVPDEKASRFQDAFDSITSVPPDSGHRPSSSSSSLSTSHSWPKKKSPSLEDQSVLSACTSPTSSTAPSTCHKSSTEEQDKDSSTPNLPNNIPSPFLHPLFPGVPPATFGFVPGLYFGGQTFPRAPLPSTFPAAIPFHIQQNYIAAAAAAAAAAGSVAASTSTQNQSLSSKSETSESSPFLAHQTSSHPVALQPSQTQVPPFKSAIHPLSSSQGNSVVQASFSSSSSSSQYNRPKSTRSSADNHIDDDDDSSSQVHSPEDLTMGGKMSRKQRKNYKNMTRERRVEANARERTRVHTISAAFEALRRAVPSYSYNQKLSKLAILRIACSYIMSLARLADLDYTSDSEHIQKPLTFAECVDMCTNTIQTEGRARRRH